MGVQRDYMASRFLAKGISVDGYSKVYFSSNENIFKAIKNLDIRDKSVMTVLASSDQLFYFNHLGAREVDTFDNNILTMYYYYLRKWSILFKSQIVPDYLKNNDYSRLKELLSIVKIDENNEEEKNALIFWKRHLENRTDFSRMFYREYLHYDEKYDLEGTKTALDKPLNYRFLDITKETEFDKQYDLIYLSNIIEWVQMDKEKLTGIKNNLLKLITEDGQVLCTNFFSKDDMVTPQVRIVFDEEFERQPLSSRAFCLKRK
jgi:hypothetical protein